MIHNIDYADIDEKDEISGDEQLCLIWCWTCKGYEWHWIKQ